MPCKLLGAFYYSTLQLANNKLGTQTERATGPFKLFH